MKTKIAVLLLAVLFTASFVYSETPQKRFATMEQKVEAAKKNLMVALHSENKGLVEAAVRMIARIKLRIPSTDVTRLQAELDEISITHPSPAVRYKAYIASNICSDPEWYAQETRIVGADENQFFIIAANRLHQKLFGASFHAEL